MPKALLSAEQMAPVERVDAVVDGCEMSLELAEELQALAPFGRENPPVCLMLARGALRSTRDRWAKGATCASRSSPRGARARAVSFGQGSRLPVAEGAPARATFALEVNEWNGVVEPRLRLRHAAAHEPAPGEAPPAVPAAEPRHAVRAGPPPNAAPEGELEQLVLL